MVSCGYTALVGGHCGCSSGNPANSQCVTIAHCNKDIQGHLGPDYMANSIPG